jgi:Kef-type K+ transport system membrane component KefB/Trk K+ transport system NAD-binding subunit
MQQGLLLDIAVCIVAAWLVAAAFQALRQPLLLAYLLAGFAVGPHGLGWVTDAASIDTIAGLGLVLLLFMIGLEIDLRRTLSAGRMIGVTGAVQIATGILAGWVFMRETGLARGWLEALYLGFATALSSTVILVKILHEKHELDTLAGRITLGVLVLQDLVAIMFLAVQPNLHAVGSGLILFALGKVGLLLAAALLMSRYLLPPVFRAVANVPELVVVGALAWCFALTGLADCLGLSQEMGALVAGIALSTFPYTLDVTAKVTSIRDFFVTLFFVGLGMAIPVPTQELLGWTAAICGFLLVTRLVTVFVPLYAMKQGHRMSLLPAVYLSQMSELSLVLLALGKAAGEVSERALSVAALSFSLLAVVSAYVAFKTEFILRTLSPMIARLGLKDLAAQPAGAAAAEKTTRVLILGFSRTASSLLEVLSRDKPSLLPELGIVDFNPEVNARLRQRGLHVRLGDISHRDVLVHAGVPQAGIIVCSLPDSVLKGTSNLTLLRNLRELNPGAKIVATAERMADVPALYAASADYVIVPRLLEAGHLLDALNAAEKNLLPEMREVQAMQLEGRKEIVA